MLNQTIRYAAPIALAAYCGLMCERAAVINIGIEGMMLMGAMVAYGVNVYALRDEERWDGRRDRR